VNRANAPVQEKADQKGMWGWAACMDRPFAWLTPRFSSGLGWPPLTAVTKSDLDHDFSPYDLKRLHSYAQNMLDYHVIVDLVPTIAMHVFLGITVFVHVSVGGSAYSF